MQDRSDGLLRTEKLLSNLCQVENRVLLLCRCSYPSLMTCLGIFWWFDFIRDCGNLGLDSSKLRDRLVFPWHSDPETEILSLEDSMATFLMGMGSEVESCLSTILTLPSSKVTSSSWKLGSWPGRGEIPPPGPPPPPLHRFLVPPSPPRGSPTFPRSCCTWELFLHCTVGQAMKIKKEKVFKSKHLFWAQF